MKKYKINRGYDYLGRERNVYFFDLTAARRFANDYFNRTGIVVAIEEVKKISHEKN